MKANSIAAACAFATLALAQSAARADDGPTQLKVSGYGTIAAILTNDDKREFVGGSTTSKGATNKPDIGQDSRFGLQGVLSFQNNISITGQVVAKRRLADTGSAGSDKDFNPAVDWLFAQYDVSPDFNVRLGRMAVPTYLLSDSLDVGYAANWLRAPVHLYRSEIYTDADGAELNYKHSFGGYNVSAQALHGRSKAPLYAGGAVFSLPTDNLNAFNVTVEHGNWLGRVGVTRSTFYFAPFASTIKDSYASVGLQYDDGQLIVMSEYAKRSQNKLAILNGKQLQNAGYAYVAAGWHFGKFLPMIMVSEDTTRTNFAIGHGIVVGSKQDNIAPSLALRYDAAPNVAVKAQIDRYNANDKALFTPAKADTAHKVNVYSVGVDFVF